MTVGRHQKENFYLKADFIGYLQTKNLAPKTIESYLWNLKLFLAWTGKEETQITKPDVLKYLEHLKNERKQKNKSRSMLLNCLNHYFTFLYNQEQISVNPCLFLKIRGTQTKTLYRLYTNGELQQLYDNYYTLFVFNYDFNHIPQNQRKQAILSRERNAVILNILVYQGISTKEIDTLALCDVDLVNATLKIQSGSKIGCGRVLPLHATQIGILMNYIQNTRPQFAEYHKTQSEQLFLSLPCSSKTKYDNENLTVLRVFPSLKKHLKSIDKHFVNFAQIRASVISNWLHVYGLRKTQIMAGHKNISTTENYLSNDLQQLTNDIDKLHPF